jgi:hypothetical protein
MFGAASAVTGDGRVGGTDIDRDPNSGTHSPPPPFCSSDTLQSPQNGLDIRHTVCPSWRAVRSAHCVTMGRDEKKKGLYRLIILDVTGLIIHWNLRRRDHAVRDIPLLMRLSP